MNTKETSGRKNPFHLFFNTMHAETGHTFKFEQVEIIHKFKNTFNRKLIDIGSHTHINTNSIK